MSEFQPAKDESCPGDQKEYLTLSGFDFGVPRWH